MELPKIKVADFEGPFDLLLHLIKKNKMDIYNVEIYKVTNQYLEYLNTRKVMDLEITSEFIVVAATLIEIKSKNLLPKVKVEEEENEEDMVGNDIGAIRSSSKAATTSKIVNLHTTSSMKVVIVEPKKYEDVTVIADHLKQKRTVIVNLEGLAQDVDTRKAIFYFMSGAVYVLDGTIQKVSRAIFILAPSNVDIDANMKKELESKAFFPWQK